MEDNRFTQTNRTQKPTCVHRYMRSLQSAHTHQPSACLHSLERVGYSNMAPCNSFINASSHPVHSARTSGALPYFYCVWLIFLFPSLSQAGAATVLIIYSSNQTVGSIKGEKLIFLFLWAMKHQPDKDIECFPCTFYSIPYLCRKELKEFRLEISAINYNTV